MTIAISEYNTKTFEVEKVAEMAAPIGVSARVGERIYLVDNSHLAACDRSILTILELDAQITIR